MPLGAPFLNVCSSQSAQTFLNTVFENASLIQDRLCGLVVRVPGYISGGHGFDSRALQEKKK
jgi:hypothetical protein